MLTGRDARCDGQEQATSMPELFQKHVNLSEIKDQHQSVSANTLSKFTTMTTMFMLKLFENKFHLSKIWARHQSVLANTLSNSKLRQDTKLDMGL